MRACWPFARQRNDRARRKTRRPVLVGAVAVCAVILAGCEGYPTPPTAVSSSQATLHADVSCQATTTTNPCEAYFQLWNTTHNNDKNMLDVPTSPVVYNHAVTNLTFTESADDLTPGTLYHYQICGKGDEVKSVTCMGPKDTDTSNAPRTRPSSINASQSFVTADLTPPATHFRTQSTVGYGRDLSTGETANNVVYSRDEGQCVEYSTSPPKCLWLFGDTGIKRTGTLLQIIKGSTAAIATFTQGKPTSVSLTEVDSPLGTESGYGAYQFLNTSSLANCPNSQGRYVNTAANVPGSTTVTIVFFDACITTKILYPEAEGVVTYDPVTNEFLNSPTIAFTTCPPSTCTASTPVTVLPTRELFNAAVYYKTATTSGIFKTKLYLYSEEGPATAGHAYVARVIGFAATTPGAYNWYQGSGSWSSDYSTATPIAPVGYYTNQTSVGNALSINGTFVMMTQSFTILSVLVASKPWGPFAAPSGYTTGKGDNGIIPDTCKGGEVGCYAVVVHPELSTSSELAYSWYSPDDSHIRIGTIPW